VDVDPASTPIISWFIGARNAETARLFIGDLASRLVGRVQLTSDSLKAYLEAVEHSAQTLITPSYRRFMAHHRRRQSATAQPNATGFKGK